MTKTPQKTPRKGLKEPWKKGECPNPNGRPNGQRNYATIYREALMKIAASQNMTFEEMENILIQSGLTKALKGDYKFYQDVLDRIHGKPVQKNDTKLDGAIEVTIKKL